MSNNPIQQIYLSYQDKKAAVQAFDNKIKEAEKKIERLKKRKDKIRCHWTDNLIRPVMEELVKITPDIQWEMKERLIPLGMRCNCSVFGKTKNNITVGVTFTPGADDTLNFDTGEYHTGCQNNTLGDLNGFNNITAGLTDIKQLVELIRKKEANELERIKNTSQEIPK